ncbi:MAG: GNAT family N-acetyltransferase [Gemmatimonadetes bacterium]|nr:GNAT family N-acetyltransferase [Gemmatimonadota bacterium]
MTIDQVQIRKAIAADIPVLFEIRTAVNENAMTEADLAASGITPERSEELLRTEGRCWVAEAGKPVVGFCIANSKTRSIWALFVLPAYEGRGIGRRLAETAVDWLWQNGAEEIWLETETNTRAEGFYEHLGWRRGEVVIKDGYEEVRYNLKKSISPSLD